MICDIESSVLDTGIIFSWDILCMRSLVHSLGLYCFYFLFMTWVFFFLSVTTVVLLLLMFFWLRC